MRDTNWEGEVGGTSRTITRIICGLAQKCPFQYLSNVGEGVKRVLFLLCYSIHDVG